MVHTLALKASPYLGTVVPKYMLGTWTLRVSTAAFKVHRIFLYKRGAAVLGPMV